jgi:hypothetical protein
MTNRRLGMGLGKGLGAVVSMLVLVGCTADSVGGATGLSGGTFVPTSGSTADDDGSTGLKLDVGMDTAVPTVDMGDECMPTENATVRGRVFSPNLEIPIAGAVVYVTANEAEPVPDEVYCAECVKVACDEQFVLTEADGTFEVPASAGPGRKLVVQKGQFLRVTEIDVALGENMVSPDQSNLPDRWYPGGGMWIPRIAVIRTTNDSIYNILAKVGLGNVSDVGGLVEGTEKFDLLSQAEGGALLDDLDAMREYHIIFVPCMAQVGMGSIGAQRLDNIRQWVSEGGKWYVTDWANEYLYEGFPNYQHMHGESVDPDLDYYDTTGMVLDPGLQAWLEALPDSLKDIGNGHPNLLSLPEVELVHNWSGIDAIYPVMVENDEGEQVDVGHRAWVEGPCPVCTPAETVRPMTISAEYGCGRMMFSTYHTDEGEHLGLTPQELILLYIILEIGVCHETPPPPPPPVG